MARITDRDMQLVRSNYAELRIAKFPPELMSNHDDIQRSIWLAGVFSVEDDASGSQEQNDNDDHGNYRPGKFDLATAINLRGLMIRISCTLAITHKDVSEETSRSEKNAHCNCKHKHRQPKAQMCWSAFGRKNTGLSVPEPGRNAKQPMRGHNQPPLKPALRKPLLMYGESRIKHHNKPLR